MPVQEGLMKYLTCVVGSVVCVGMPALAQDILDDFQKTGNVGVLGADGDVERPPTGGEYLYVSTAGGASGTGSLVGVGGSGIATNGSVLTSKTFNASAGDQVVFSFNYVTSDGSGFADYSWARLLDTKSNASNDVILYTARTTTGGATVPGFSMPAPNAKLDPASSPITAGAPIWSPLGSSSGTCYSTGCGYTGWTRATYEVDKDSEYQLQFGVTNWTDTAYDSGMAIKNLTPAFKPVKTPVAKVENKESLGDVSLFGDNLGFDPSKPTVVVTHGWQDSGFFDKTVYTGGFSNIDFSRKMYDAVKFRENKPDPEDYNVIMVSWEDAFTDAFGTAQASAVLEPLAKAAGLKLATDLDVLFGDGYKEPIHFIGHSLGSVLNNRAVETLTRRNYTIDQVTVLDAPLIGTTVNRTDFKALTSNKAVTYVDNYYGAFSPVLQNSAFGLKIKGTEEDGGYFYDTDHTGVWERYSQTVNGAPLADGGFLYSAALEDQGLFSQRPGAEVAKPVFDFVPADMTSLLELNAVFDTKTTTASVFEGSDGYILLGFEKMFGAEALSFDFELVNAGDGDMFEFALNNVLQDVFVGSLFGEGIQKMFIDLTQM